MKYIIPLIIKFLVISFVLSVVLWMVDLSFMNSIILSLFVTSVTFLLDLVLLPKYGNVVLTIIDFAVVYLMVLFGSTTLSGGINGIGWVAFTPAIIIALWEAFFHKYLRKRFFEDAFRSIDATYDRFDGKEQFGPAELEHLRTEFSNEFDIGNPYRSGEVAKKKKYVPHRRKKRHKKNPY